MVVQQRRRRMALPFQRMAWKDPWPAGCPKEHNAERERERDVDGLLSICYQEILKAMEMGDDKAGKDGEGGMRGNEERGSLLAAQER